jgi:hypothetical protein
LVLESGKIVEEGSPAALLANQNSRLVKDQPIRSRVLSSLINICTILTRTVDVFGLNEGTPF